VLCVELWLSNGFTPSVLIANRMLLTSFSNHIKWLLMLPHCPASARCLTLPSFLSSFQPSSCQRKSWAFFHVVNHLLSRGKKKKANVTSDSPGSFSSSALLSSPPSFSSCTDHNHTSGTCQALHNLHRTIHNCSSTHGFFQPLFLEDKLSSLPHRQTLLFGFLRVACL
jgi:hypothetical protein